MVVTSCARSKCSVAGVVLATSFMALLVIASAQPQAHAVTACDAGDRLQPVARAVGLQKDDTAGTGKHDGRVETPDVLEWHRPDKPQTSALAHGVEHVDETFGARCVADR